MTKDLLNELKEFLNDANLNTYEINTFIMLLGASKGSPPTAREISSESGVPIGRIYEILEDLHSKGLVEIIESRPKKYRSIPVNEALNNLISYQLKENKRKVGYLYDRAKLFESELFESDSSVFKTSSRLFWSTAYDFQSIMPVYIKNITDTKEELLFNEYITSTTIKIIPYGKFFYDPLREALNRGISVKILWNFQLDHRPITQETKDGNAETFLELSKILKEHFQLSKDHPGFDTRYIHRRIPTLHDIFDKKRVIFKIQDPLKPYRVFSIMNVVDPILAEKLRDNFLAVWNLEALR
ncbi:MAG: TrmB family transcriptional regulator [Candidatus Lokiarchaeota archaeon]|nr:TrmB family transcriptional regulator [Candidatus Lokiarchaeota archaeon]